MSYEERNSLLNEIEEIKTTIETLQPVVQEQETRFGEEPDNRRSQFIALRKHLARDMELLHAA
jgi:hypothetical protein